MADVTCATLRETLVLLIGREMARIQYDPTQTQTIQDLRDAFELLIGPDAVIITRSRACANPWCRKVYAGDGAFAPNDARSKSASGSKVFPRVRARACA